MCTCSWLTDTKLQTLNVGKNQTVDDIINEIAELEKKASLQITSDILNTDTQNNLKKTANICCGQSDTRNLKLKTLEWY